jgi:hypothetical protein
MNKYKVRVASTIYYEAIVDAKSEEDIHEYFNKGAIDFTTWREIDLESSIESIREIKTCEA